MSSFSEFQKSEYEHIAEAHFKAIEAISFFFRYYLLVMSLPIPILAVLFGFSGRGKDFETAAVSLIGLASPFFIVVGVVGFCMMMYITNLKMDVVLYSRVVNSIRKYFYDTYDADHTNKLLMRQLPQSAYIPPYRDVSFGFVILAFAVFNALYIGLGAHVLFVSQWKDASSLEQLGFGAYRAVDVIVVSIIPVSAFCLHFISYFIFARHREFGYLRSSAIGVDIDGVLNKHREKFCEMAATKLGKHIQPDEIKILPVHENADLSEPITRDDERQIFNDPRYWLEMPELEGAADAIRSIRQAFLLPVHIFTHRPWPDVMPHEAVNRADLNASRRSWRSAANEMLKRSNAKVCARIWVYLATRWNYRTSIKYITKYWLLHHRVMFDSLLVERGNENIVYSRGRYENRFNYAKKKRIKFFVEDDWIKAVKLSYICDVVFLIDHPYNRALAQSELKHANHSIIGRLPANVVRVESWVELKRIIGQLV